MSDLTKLEPTAAMVMKMSEPLAKNDDFFAKYLSTLDLSSAEDFIEYLSQEGLLNYAIEITCNRKHTIKKSLVEFVEKSNDKLQLVSLACGKSPVLLEIYNLFKEKPIKYFEVDITPLEDKKKIYKKLINDSFYKFQFLNLDLLSKDFSKLMNESGLNHQIETFFIIEGLSHYIEEKSLTQLMQSIRMMCKKSSVLVEYSPPFKKFDSPYMEYSQKFFSSIEDFFFQSGMYQYDASDMKEIFEISGGKVIKSTKCWEMEKARTKKND